MSEQLPGGQYVIASTLDFTKVLGVQGGQANDDTPVDLCRKDEEETNQCWQLTKISDGSDVFYTIGHPNSSMAMEAPASFKENDFVVMRGHQKGDDPRNRQWILKPVPDQESVYTIINRNSLLAIDVPGGNANKSEIRQWRPHTHSDGRQRWKLVRAATTIRPLAVPIYQYHSLQTAGSEYKFSKSSDAGGGWTLDGIGFYAFAQPSRGTVPIYAYRRVVKNTNFYRFRYSTDPNNPEAGRQVWTQDGIEFYAFAQSSERTVPVYQYHRVYSGRFWRFRYSADPNIRHGWTNDEVKFHAFSEAR